MVTTGAAEASGEGAGRDAGAALARADALHTALTEVVLEGGDLARIAAEASGVLGCGVAVTSSDGRERAAALADEDRAALAGAELLDPTGRVRVERIGADGVAWARRRGEVRALRVAAAGSDLARLVAVRRGSAIPADDVHALERAATVAALLITREEAITAVENKYQGDFLREVFAGRVHDEHYVDEHTAAFGWDLDRPVVVVVAEIDPSPTTSHRRAPSGGAGRSGSRRRGGRCAPRSTRGCPRSTSPPRWSRCCPVAGEADVEGVVAAGGRRRPRVTAGVAGGRSPSASAGSRTGWPTCRTATGRRGGPSRWGAGCGAAGRRRTSTSSACTG